MTAETALVESARHRLDGPTFDALAEGGGDSHAIKELLRAERSWRLIQLRTVMESAGPVDDATGPLEPLAAAWELLRAAEQKSADDVNSVVRRPQVGVWAGYMLRRQSGIQVADPPWVDLGYFHAVAAACAIRAGIDFAVTIPVRRGFATLPTMGGARLAGADAWGTAKINSTNGHVTISSADAVIDVPAAGEPADGWVAMPVLRGDAGGLELSVMLEHLDPYRGLGAPVRPDVLTPQRLNRWQELLARAWAVLVEVSAERAASMVDALMTIVPVPAGDRFRIVSVAARDAFGAVVVSEPHDPVELAVALLREFQHMKLASLSRLAPLHETQATHRMRVPWRDDPQPVGEALRALYSGAGVTEFWRGYRDDLQDRTAQSAQFEFARGRRQVLDTLRSIEPDANLSEYGRLVVAGLNRKASAWRDEVVKPYIEELANAAEADSAARWRLHHLRPTANEVAEFVAARQTGSGTIPFAIRETPDLVPDGSARRLDMLAALVLWRFADLSSFGNLCAAPSRVGDRVDGAEPAVLALAAGDYRLARRWFLLVLAHEPMNTAAWAGLGVVEAVINPGPAAEALRDAPELVCAAFGALSRVGVTDDPLDLAAWMGQALLSSTAAVTGHGERER